MEGRPYFTSSFGRFTSYFNPLVRKVILSQEHSHFHCELSLLASTSPRYAFVGNT